MELEQQLRAAFAPCSSGSAVRAAVLARLAATQRRGGARLRRLTLVGGLAALAAAAGILAIYLGTGRASKSRLPAVVMPAATPPAALPPAADVTSVPVAAVAPLLVPPEDPLPRLLPPDYSAQETAIDLALQQAADVHPELVDGPDTDGLFALTLLIRADGTLVSSVVRLIPAEDPGAYRLASEDMAVPFDASQSAGFRDKGAVLPDGRSLRAPVHLQLGVVSDSYDFARSELLVRAAIRKQYGDLVLPTEWSRVTIFLAEDGSIQRESVDHQAQLASPPFSYRADEPDRGGRMAQYVAREVATRLALDVDQVGLVGGFSIELARSATVPDAAGTKRRDGKGRLEIVYAWPRRAGESGPVFGQFGPGGKAPAALEPKFNEAAALAILRREIPDAFIVDTDVAGTLGVFLTHQGELIRAERLPALPDGVNNDFELVLQLAPGVKMGEGTRWNIKDETGKNANVLFAWGEKPAPPAAK